MIGPLATIFQWVYGLFLLAVGLTGIFFLEWELAQFYAIDMSSLTDQSGATFLNQYRFLKALEAGFGLFCLLQRKDILAGGVNTLIFLAACGLGLFARCVAWASDGAPDGIFFWFMGIEAVTFVLVWLHTRRDWDAR